MSPKMFAMRRWPYTFAVILSVSVGLTAVVASHQVGVPLRDPDGFLGPAYIRLPLIGVLFFAAGIIPQAIRRGGMLGAPKAMRSIVREEWTWGRVGNIATGLIAFYVCYVSYRNLKSYLPIVREDVLFDHELLQLDHFLMFGNNPAPLMHDWLGTGIAAQVLATSYLSYLPLIPLTLGLVLTWSRNVSLGAWYATALSLNWVLGAISYYILPTLGPAFFQPSMFADLPDSGVSALQISLFKNGVSFKENPTGNDIYGIAGFASLHVSVVVTACLFFERTGQRAMIRIAGWVFLATTVLATVYFGWHYILDDVAGAIIGWAAVSIGAWATGNRGRRKRRLDEDDQTAVAPSAGAGSGEAVPSAT